MDDLRFDRLTRLLGQTLGRRRLGVLLVELGLLASVAPVRKLKAKKKKKKKSCKNGTVRCGKACVNKQTNPAHCGGCNRPCGQRIGCVGGVCQGSCQSPNTLCGGECVDTRTDPDNCGECGNECDANETCDDSECVETVACHPDCRRDGSQNDQTCPGQTGYCPCAQHCGAGWCGECCEQGGGVSTHCYDSPNGPECFEPVDPNHAGNYICGCKQFIQGQTRKLCQVGEGCSTCCSSGECQAGPGQICTTVVPSPFIGRSCCLPKDAACGSNSQCCSDICSNEKCGCRGQGQNCGAFEACCSGVCSTITHKCE